MVRERLWPERIDFEARGRYSGGFDCGLLLQEEARYRKCAQHRQKDDADVDITVHVFSSEWVVERFSVWLEFYTNTANLFIGFRLEFHDLVAVHDVPHTYGFAADFTVFDVGLAANRSVEHHRNLLATVR